MCILIVFLHCLLNVTSSENRHTFTETPADFALSQSQSSTASRYKTADGPFRKTGFIGDLSLVARKIPITYGSSLSPEVRYSTWRHGGNVHRFLSVTGKGTQAYKWWPKYRYQFVVTPCVRNHLARSIEI